MVTLEITCIGRIRFVLKSNFTFIWRPIVHNQMIINMYTISTFCTSTIIVYSNRRIHVTVKFIRGITRSWIIHSQRSRIRIWNFILFSIWDHFFHSRFSFLRLFTRFLYSNLREKSFSFLPEIWTGFIYRKSRKNCLCHREKILKHLPDHHESSLPRFKSRERTR